MHEPAETIHSEEHEGWKVDVFHDWDAQSPASWDQLGTLVAFPSLWREYRFAERESSGTEDDALDRRGFALVARYLRLVENEFAVPFHFQDYGSGGGRLFAGDEDDDNPSGFIVTTHERVNELCGTDPKYHTREWIEEALRSELQEWGQYVEGDVWGYCVEGPGGVDHDSCWGFYGFEYACAEARSALESCIEWAAREELKVSRSCAL